MKHHKNQHNRDSHEENHPDAQEIARHAYELYQKRGGEPGHDFEDWLQAERELKEKDQAAMSNH